MIHLAFAIVAVGSLTHTDGKVVHVGGGDGGDTNWLENIAQLILDIIYKKLDICITHLTVGTGRCSSTS